mmetsp:Transcript_50735/g.58172  ORF Transcript_50735/g.58172 Transcript_50735/m.58172 type:complete len:275 (-) Transcript_50735:375-1199(-)
MLPVVSRTSVFNSGFQSGSHGGHTSRHTFNFLIPQSKQFFITNDGVDNSGSVNGRIGIHKSGNETGMSLDLGSFLGITSEETQATNSLTIETEVFSERLRHDQGNIIGNKGSHGISIVVGITSGESLVSVIEQDKVFLLLDHLSDFVPLFMSGVNTSRIVSTEMQQNNGMLGSFLERSQHTVEVESTGGRIIIIVEFEFHIRSGNTILMVSPGRVGQQNREIFVRVIMTKEFESHSQGTSSGNTLESNNATILQGLTVGSITQFKSRFNKIGVT